VELLTGVKMFKVGAGIVGSAGSPVGSGDMIPQAVMANRVIKKKQTGAVVFKGEVRLLRICLVFVETPVVTP
jgi:hypothetical protein